MIVPLTPSKYQLMENVNPAAISKAYPVIKHKPHINLQWSPTIMPTADSLAIVMEEVVLWTTQGPV